MSPSVPFIGVTTSSTWPVAPLAMKRMSKALPAASGPLMMDVATT